MNSNEQNQSQENSEDLPIIGKIKSFEPFEPSSESEINSSDIDEQKVPKHNLFEPKFVPNHSMRRKMLRAQGLLKQKRRLNDQQWFKHIADQQEAGKILHKANTEDQIKRDEDFWDETLKKVAKSHLEAGYSEEYVANVIEKIQDDREKLMMKKIQRKSK